MSAHGHSIRSLYFDFGPVAGHVETCPRHGTDEWEVTRYLDKRFDGEVRKTTIRYACHECGMVHFDDIDGPVTTFETTNASEAGYTSKPEKVAGLYLWPGPRIWHGDDRGPTAYYVTRTKDRPREPGDCTGIVTWNLGKRGGVKWFAGLEPTEHGTVRARADQGFSSRRAAVAWITSQIGGAR